VLFSITDADDDASATLDVSTAYNNTIASLMICDDVAKVIINRDGDDVRSIAIAS